MLHCSHETILCRSARAYEYAVLAVIIRQPFKLLSAAIAVAVSFFTQLLAGTGTRVRFMLVLSSARVYSVKRMQLA
jgi:hypothetical protein